MRPVHRPVLTREVVDFLNARAGGVFVDATFGGGGHSKAILEAHASNRVVAVDRDAEALERGRRELAGDGPRVTFVHDDHRHLDAVLDRAGVERPDGLLADLGISTLQLRDPDRGFGFDVEGPLDMRMDRTAARTAADLVNTLPEKELRTILRTRGEEPHAGRIARAIVRQRETRPLTTTRELAEVVRAAVPVRGPRRIHPATRTFQALRIAVNDELSGLDAFVERAAERLRPGGRLVFIAFHSLEDRPVKQTLRRLADRCICPPDLPVCGCHRPDLVRVLTPRPVRPTAAEVQANPASRSARLRAAERLAA